MLLAAACVLKPAELQVFLLMNANWRPTAPNASAGRAVLPYRAARALAGRGGTTIAKALLALLAGSWVELVRAGTRPVGPGGARGEAAVYDIPRRHGGAQPLVELPPSLLRPRGTIRWNVHRLRHDVQKLSGAALKVLAFAVAHRHRSRESEVVDPSPFRLPARQTARLLGLSPATIARAIEELLETRCLAAVERARGRAPAAYILDPAYTKHERRVAPLPAPPPLHGSYKESCSETQSAAQGGLTGPAPRRNALAPHVRTATGA